MPAHFIQPAGGETHRHAAIGIVRQALIRVETELSDLGGDMRGKTPFDLLRCVPPCAERLRQPVRQVKSLGPLIGLWAIVCISCLVCVVLAYNARHG